MVRELAWGSETAQTNSSCNTFRMFLTFCPKKIQLLSTWEGHIGETPQEIHNSVFITLF